jgi:hypothetical protein
MAMRLESRKGLRSRNTVNSKFTVNLLKIDFLLSLSPRRIFVKPSR